jgi:hypothetical protein
MMGQLNVEDEYVFKMGGRWDINRTKVEFTPFQSQLQDCIRQAIKRPC